MAENGLTTTLLPSAGLIDDVIGNRDLSTVRIPFSDLAIQLIGSGPLPDALDTLEAQITSGVLLKATWAELQALSGVADGAGGEVDEADAGTHADASATGYDGAVVANAGRYSYNATWGRWARVGASGLAGKLAKTSNLGDLDDPVAALLNLGLQHNAVYSTVLDPVLASMEVDENGVILRGVEQRGGAVVEPAYRMHSALGAPWAFAISDPEGEVVLGWNPRGALVVGPAEYSCGFEPDVLRDASGALRKGSTQYGVDMEAQNFAAWIEGGEVFAEVFGRKVQLTAGAAHTYTHAEIRGGLLTIRRLGAAPIKTPLAGRYPDIGDTRVVHWSDQYGQSNGAGNASLGVINDAPFSERFLMFAGGQRTFGNVLGHSQGKDSPMAPFYDAIHDFASGFEQEFGGAGETANSGFAYGLINGSGFAADAAILTTCSAIGSASAQMLPDGALEDPDGLGPNEAGDAWENLETKFIRAALFWTLQGLRFVANGVRYNQGEGNIGNDKATYLAHKVLIRDAVQQLALEWNALPQAGDGGFVGKVPLVSTQTCSGAHYGVTASEVPFAQLQINLDDPTTALCCGPVYDQPVNPTDGVHLLKEGQQMQGARQAVAMNAWLRGELWMPLHIRKDAGFEPVRTGAVVRCRVYNHFDLPLIFDAVTITGLGADQGFSWHDNGDGNAVIVASAAIIDSTTIDLTLSAIPTGTGGAIGIALNGTNLGSAGPATGNRATLRTDGSAVTTKDGQAVEHFICIDRVSVA